MESGPLPEVVKAVKKAGIEIHMWISIIDEGAPPTSALTMIPCHFP